MKIKFNLCTRTEHIISYLDTYFIRETLRDEAEQKLGFDLAVFEKVYETMEGTARWS
ncbi:MAG TPA: hypothetical protein VK921_18830 [Anditalea sp.]|nr:hypothetical protein [Anditalea sp.]